MRCRGLLAAGALVALLLVAESAPVKVGRVKLGLKRRDAGRVLSTRMREHEPTFRAVERGSMVHMDGTVGRTSTTVELNGGITSLGMYYTYITVGGQRVDLQVDTGSSVMALPRNDCSSCKRGDNRYNPDSSGTSREVMCHDDDCDSSQYGACSGNYCHFSLAYADGSGASGVLMCDKIDWGSATGVEACFGAITSDSPDFERQNVDGILGMASKSLACSPTCVTPLFDAVREQGKVQSDLFTICIEKDGGSLTLGEANEDVFDAPIEWQRMDSTSFYRIFLATDQPAIMVGDQEIRSYSYSPQVIVDSGTTLITVPKNVFMDIKEEFLANYCNVPDLCGSQSWFDSGMCVIFDEDEDDVLDNQLPVISIVLESGFRIELTGRDYLLEYAYKKQVYRCLGIMYMGSSEEYVLGNTFMMKYSTVYDRENDRLGLGKRAETCV